MSIFDLMIVILSLRNRFTLACCQVAEAEKSLSAAKRMVKFMDSTDMTAMIFEDGDEAEVAELYRTCARVCYAGNVSNNNQDRYLNYRS